MRRRARDLPTGAAKAAAVREMFDRIAPRYDLVNRVMTFGLDRFWRRATVAALGLPRGSLVLDLACGTGDLCDEARSAGLDAVGFDSSWGMLERAHTAAPLVAADVLRMPVGDGCADGITCGFALRNVVDLGALFAECARVLRPGGRVALLDVGRPRNPLLRAGHALYFEKVVPLIGGLLSDRSAYSYLPASAAYLPPTAELVAMLEAAGFTGVAARSLGLGAVQLLTGTRR